ncbi:unnamed protein product, partial [Mesorhabditis spiculigera]
MAPRPTRRRRDMAQETPFHLAYDSSKRCWAGILFCECKVHPGSSGYCMVIVYMVACFMLPAIAIGAFVGYMGYKRGKAGKKMIGG